ncbi:MAG TPA: hypothetical protein VN436_06900 [Holophaga sp.]|nr:hypothetical protein [Holophaga sp.]
MSPWRRIARLPLYLWAGPCSLAGLVVVSVALGMGAQARLRDGTLQVAGGRFASFLSRLPTRLRILAFTNGHVIFALSWSVMDDYRAHELVHVRQYERWGPLFPVLYLGASLLLKLRGRDPYFDNPFERAARRAEPGP